MKTIILAGGLGTRLSEYTDTLPKPMIRIGDKPILCHIMQIYAQYGHKDFYVAVGYKGELIKEYFNNHSDLEIDLAKGKVTPSPGANPDWQVTLIDTGEKTMTGGRVKRLFNYIGNETCMLTYGDGVANIDVDALIAFHKSHGRLMTMTAVHPPARFGELELTGDRVLSFKEKPQLRSGWINGGYFVIEPKFFELIAGDETMLEREPIEKAVIMGEVMAYRHEGFWQCMDTKRDHELLESIWAQGAPWV
jgi:glucose-1-phosphate cytidylyltransferase